MSNTAELYCIESTSETSIIEEIIQNELKRADGLPQELAVKVLPRTIVYAGITILLLPFLLIKKKY